VRCSRTRDGGNKDGFGVGTHFAFPSFAEPAAGKPFLSVLWPPPSVL
jgi:hypothetical protein